MKKLCSIFLVACLLLQMGNVFAYDDAALRAAQTLYTLGLLKGNSDTFSAEGMELDRTATRAEISVTITRMLGKDEKARYQQNAHPFTDVPDWASDYVGWLYENYLVNGTSDTYFGANDIASVQQFCTMMLRVLGYSDAEGDFSYADAKYFAQSIGLIDDQILPRNELVRGDMVKICLKALQLPIKNSNRLLSTKLSDEKVFSKALAEEIGLTVSTNVLDGYFAAIDKNLPDISASKSGNAIRIHVNGNIEEYGVRVFYTSKSQPTVTEIPLGTSGLHYEKGKISYLGGGAAGYINQLDIYGITDTTDFQVIVIKTSSEDALYNILGKSNITTLK